MFQPLDDLFEGCSHKLGVEVDQEDITRLMRLDCIAGAIKRVCDYQGALTVGTSQITILTGYSPDVTPELSVYRYSEDKLLAYLKIKVERLAKPSVSELSRSVTRSLARDGLMEDGKEGILEGTLFGI